MGCFTLFATHFHELAGLENVTVGVHNRHATAAVDTSSGQLTFLYALAPGAADQSYGAHVAELAGFPKRVVEAAKQRAIEFEAAGTFGRPAKRARSASDGDSSGKELLRYATEATTEDEFVARALEHAATRVSECGA